MGHQGGTPKTNCKLWHASVINECMIATAVTIVSSLICLLSLTNCDANSLHLLGHPLVVPNRQSLPEVQQSA